MSYLFQILLLGFLFSCALLGDAFWSWSSFLTKKIQPSLLYKSIAIVSGLLIYSGADYMMLDLLMLIPEKIYVIA